MNSTSGPAASDIPTMTAHGVEYRLPFRDLFRPLTADEKANLRRSVQQIGIEYQVITYNSPTYGPRCIIDGAERLRLTDELGAPCPVKLIPSTDCDARRLAEDLNGARRHSSPEEVRAARSARIARVAAKWAEGASIRAVADAEGIDPKQVQRDLTAAAKSGVDTVHTSPPGTVVGLDGKAYPSSRPAAGGAEQDDAIGDATEPDPDTGAVSFDYGANAAPPKTLPGHWRPGGRPAVPSPHQKMLDRLTALGRDLTVYVNQPENEMVREVLALAGWVRTRDVTVKLDDGTEKHFGHVFVGLKPIRELVKLAGKGRRCSKQTVLKVVAEALGQPAAAVAAG